MTTRTLTIGLFGFGVVGEGIYKVLQDTPTLQASVKKICIKNADKKRNAPPSLFTTSYQDILDDDTVDVVVELISDADEAFKIVSAALLAGKNVVSANKRMIAEHFSELLESQRQSGRSLLYEASVCGSIPIIRNLEEYYDNDLLQSICGIVNGSTNYILTKMNRDQFSYSDALQLAQENGFAEADPSLDVSGTDALNKLVIILAHAYGIVAKPDNILSKGIDRLHPFDAMYAAEKGLTLKLTAQAKKLSNGDVAAFVLPQLVRKESQLFGVEEEYNGVILESKLADKQFLYGKGAGRYPTSSAVLSDIAALRYDYKYEYRKLKQETQSKVASNFFLKVYVSFDQWADVNKWDFESIDAFHSTMDRQYLIGTILVEKLRLASWFHDTGTSLVVLPDGIIEKEKMTINSLKKISLQLAGVYS